MLFRSFSDLERASLERDRLAGRLRLHHGPAELHHPLASEPRPGVETFQSRAPSVGLLASASGDAL